MISLNAMAELLQSGEVVVNGAKVKVRAITAGEHADVLAALPKPAAPMTKDPNRGSAAPKIENEKDPGHIAAMERWYIEFRSACIAIACGMQISNDGTGLTIPSGAQERSAWISRAAKEVSARLPLPLIERLYTASVRVGRGLPAEEPTAADAKKPGDDGDPENPTTPG